MVARRRARRVVQMARIQAAAQVALAAAIAAAVVMRVYRKRRRKKRKVSLVIRIENGSALGTYRSSNVSGKQTCREMLQSDPNLQNLPCSMVPKTACRPTGS